MEHSYNGWPASRNKADIGVKDFSVLGHSFPGGVKAGDVAFLFDRFLRLYDAHVERLTSPGDADEWGWSYRLNRNADNLSCHASGTAIDVNAQTHPNGKANTLSAAQVSALRAILKNFEGVVKWGGDFSGTKDEMHYEIHGTAADVKRVADKIRKQEADARAKAAAAATPSWYKRMLRVTSPLTRGADVTHVQTRLIALHLLPAKNAAGKSNADGIYGTDTATAVGKFQTAKKMKVTKVVDLATAKVLG